MKVMITGGLGYVGTTLIPLLFKDDRIDSIVIFDNLSNGNYNLFHYHEKLNSKVTYVEGNILDYKSLQHNLKHHNIDTVIHLAAKTTNPMSDHSFHEFDQVNHWGTSILVDAILHESKVKRVIFLSSFAVYGTYKERFSEDDDALPTSNYGKSKLLAEKEILLRLPKHINKVVLRTGLLFGNTLGFKPTTVVNKYLFEAHYKGKLQIFGNGHQKRPLLHVNRLAEFINNFLRLKSFKREIYNIVDYNVSVNEIADTIKEIYPDTDFIYMNRDHRMNSVELDSQNDLLETLNMSESNALKSRIQSDLNRFSF